MVNNSLIKINNGLELKVVERIKFNDFANLFTDKHNYKFISAEIKCRICFKSFSTNTGLEIHEKRCSNNGNTYWLVSIINGKIKHLYAGESIYLYRFMVKPLCVYISQFFLNDKFIDFYNYRNFKEAIQQSNLHISKLSSHVTSSKSKEIEKYLIKKYENERSSNTRYGDNKIKNLSKEEGDKYIKNASFLKLELNFIEKFYKLLVKCVPSFENRYKKINDVNTFERQVYCTIISLEETYHEHLIGSNYEKKLNLEAQFNFIDSLDLD